MRLPCLCALFLGIFVNFSVAFAYPYEVIPGAGDTPVRTYDSRTDTTKFTYTVKGGNSGLSFNRLRAFGIEIPKCETPLEIVSFFPDLRDGDPYPYPSTNPAIYQQVPDPFFEKFGIGWYGMDGEGTPEVLLEPGQSKTFSITIKGEILPAEIAAGTWNWGEWYLDKKFHWVPGPSCDRPGKKVCTHYSLSRHFQGPIPQQVDQMRQTFHHTPVAATLPCVASSLNYQYNGVWCPKRRLASGMCTHPVLADLLVQDCKRIGGYQCLMALSRNWIGAFMSHLKRPLRSYSYYFNQSCQLIHTLTVSEEAEACSVGKIVTDIIGYTPISLLWTDTVDLEALKTIVQFPLALESKEQWFEWKASSLSPLLVWDPAGSGVITSPAQLFGEWTFGGQPIATIEPSTGARKPTPWSNGYEALATLDSNEDGKLSGDELANISLWFDHNQDGISQTDEVSRISRKGVTALYFRDVQRLPSGELKLDVGFERQNSDGSTYRGSSIDWYGRGADTKAELD